MLPSYIKYNLFNVTASMGCIRINAIQNVTAYLDDMSHISRTYDELIQNLQKALYSNIASHEIWRILHVKRQISLSHIHI